jgi:hypothetical protein
VGGVACVGGEEGRVESDTLFETARALFVERERCDGATTLFAVESVGDNNNGA